jgi:hypothetical protein
LQLLLLSAVITPNDFCMTSVLTRGQFLALPAAVQLLLFSTVATPNQPCRTIFCVTSTTTRGLILALRAAVWPLLLSAMTTPNQTSLRTNLLHYIQSYQRPVSGIACCSAAVATTNQSCQTIFCITSTPTRGLFLALHVALQLLLLSAVITPNDLVHDVHT